MKHKMIKEHSNTKYRVELNGETLYETSVKHLAENFILSLLPEQRASVNIVPITEDGKNILLG